MERRELLKMIMAATGVAMVGSSVNAYEIGKPVPLSETAFTPEDVMLFNEIAEVIIPRTDTPGAKDANVGEMALVIANDCYSEAERNALVKGFKSIDRQCRTKFKTPFLLLNKEQMKLFVSSLDGEAKAYNQKKNIYYLGSTPNGDNAENVPHYFTLIKQLTIFSFFTSKVGATKALRFEALPGKYNGNLDYKKGDRAWAT